MLEPFLDREWLVADGHGHFAMGTAAGTRTRKYHTFCSAIAGRGERHWLALLDLECHGIGLWTHLYRAEHRDVSHPGGHWYLSKFQVQPMPEWLWDLPQGKLTAKLNALESGGFEYLIEWTPRTRGEEAPLTIRPFWAMRSLHQLGSPRVEAKPEGNAIAFVAAGANQEENRFTILVDDHPYEWRAPLDESARTYRNFSYPEESRRGYPHVENLSVAGQIELQIKSRSIVRLVLVPPTVKQESALASKPLKRSHPLQDFVLENPSGIVAGYPWFGEWGRDTFISLPGIAAGLSHDAKPAVKKEIAQWSTRVLDRWSGWVESDGMLPNLIEVAGPQWESADASLWWTHALASLWAMKLIDLKPFTHRLEIALEAMASGKHKHLRMNRDGLLEVTSPHATWMDARIAGEAVTPRVGVLPEINALWIQARALHAALAKNKSLLSDTFSLCEKVLQMNLEPERSNFVFMHSLPLAPSFLLGRKALPYLERDATRLLNEFVTPVGLRTLSPNHADYTPIYDGDSMVRDKCYHQGPVWGWLKGHFEMAAFRFQRAGIQLRELPYTPVVQSTIEGHTAELFDAEPPWSARGTPAQAWSLACSYEAVTRRTTEEFLEQWRDNT